AHVETFSGAIRRSSRSQIRFATVQAASTAVQLVLTAAVLAVVVAVAVERLHLELAALLVVAFIFSRLVPQVTSAQRNIHLFAQSLPAFGDLLDVIEACEGAAEPIAPGGDRRRRPAGGVKLDSVSFSYGATGDPVVLHDVTLEIPGNQTTALVGSSGAGKTTLADIVIGLLAPTTGRVIVGGQPLTADNLRAWRAGVGLVPQDPFLFHDTVRANLLWARPDATDDELWEALQTAAARDFVRGLAHGLDTVVGDRGARLSGGERQRVALARALLRQPELLVLDEATSSLDPANELAIRAALARLHGRTTMLVIAHRLSTISHADTVVVLNAGRIVESGTWADLATRADGRLRALIDAGAVD
ncbi:MAG: ATP-binding cassette, subfamily bacterial, partial [Actinomycetota bacterium]|nr:ATP-binding cassette, subfamily bacterial [Actinomycetota bacterium]